MAFDSIFKPELFAGQTIIVTGGDSRIWPLHKAQHSESFNGFHRAGLPDVLKGED
nr:hypothetical protein [Pseudomonas sp. H3(2019)]